MRVEPGVHQDIAIYQGGFGSGKTFCGALIGMKLSECNPPGSVGLVVAKTFPMVRDTTMRTYFEHIRAMGLKEKQHYTFNKGEAIITFHCWGNNQILFRHLEDPDKVKSLNLAWVQAEEASMLTEADFLMLLSRLRQNVPVLRWFGHTNPQATKGWIYKHFHQLGGKRIDPESGDITHKRRIIASTLDNAKNLPPGYISNMRDTYDADYYRINVLGQDGDYTQGLVVKGWSGENVQPLEYNPNYRLHLSCDFNYDPMAWVVGQVIDGTYYFLDEISAEYSTVEQCADIFSTRWPPSKIKAGLTINGDASGNNRSANTGDKTSYVLLQNRLLNNGHQDVVRSVPDANPPILDRVNAFNAKVCNADKCVRLYVDPKCVTLIDNMQNLKFKEGTSDIWVPTAHDIAKNPKSKFMGHIFDAASYFVNRYHPIVREVVQSESYVQPEFEVIGI
jgi:PBSX family phage terminase large subunit